MEQDTGFYPSNYPSTAQDMDAFRMPYNGNEMSFDFAQFTNGSNFGGHQLPFNNQAMQNFPMRQPLGDISTNQHPDMSLRLQHRISELEDGMQKVLARITELESQLLETKESHALTKSALDKLLAAEDDGRKRKRQKESEDSEARGKLQAEIHSVAKGCIGIGHYDPVAKEIVTELPHPLLPGDTASQLFHPEWNAGSTHPVNRKFIDHVVGVVHEKVIEDAKSNEPIYGNVSKKDVAHSTTIFFRHLQGTYKKQTTEEGREKGIAKNTTMRRKERMKGKTSDLRGALVDLRAEHGEEATVGAEKLVLTDFVSSEHSDRGELTQAEHEERKKLGVFETRTKAWPSNKMRLYYAYLKTLHRRRVKRETEAGKKQSTTGREKGRRYKCHPKNINRGLPPTQSDHVPYEWMVDATWKANIEAERNIVISTLPNPADFTIFSLPISLADLDKQEQEYLADDEA